MNRKHQTACLKRAFFFYLVDWHQGKHQQSSSWACMAGSWCSSWPRKTKRGECNFNFNRYKQHLTHIQLPRFAMKLLFKRTDTKSSSDQFMKVYVFFNHMQQADTKRELWLKRKSKSINHQWNQNLRKIKIVWGSDNYISINPFLSFTILRQERLNFRSRDKADLQFLLYDFYNWCTNCGSCSPHDWASCLLGMLGVFLSVALSAEAGL